MVFLRPILQDKIQYFLIGERPKLITYEVPKIFHSNYLNSISLMPKSMAQFIDPGSWHIFNKNNYDSSQIKFNVLFDDYSLKEYDIFFKIPCKALVIFLNSQNEEIFQKLEKVDRFFLISSENNEVYSKIETSRKLKGKAFNSLEQLLKKLLEFTLNELNITIETFNDLQQKRLEKAEEILQSLNFNEVSNFRPSLVNVGNICQLLALEKYELLKVNFIKHEERVKTLLDTSLVLGTLSQKLNFIDEEKIPDELPPPTIILSYPYFNPDYQKVIRKGFGKTGTNEKYVKKGIKSLRFIEQEINTYDYIMNLGGKNRELNQELFNVVTNDKIWYTAFLDFVGYLHSSFELSPYIRVPARGASLNEYISRLSPSQYPKTQTSRSISKNLAQIGKALSKNLPSEVVDFLEDYANGIFAISDLPLEWLLIKKIPLAFLCDVCRVPETGLTSVLSQFNLNSRQFFRIHENILQKTLVICGASSEDSIFKNYKGQINRHKKEGKLLYESAHIQSKREFFEIVNRLRPHLLIIDSHGDFKVQSEGSYIWLGEEKLTGNDIVEHLPQIPLIILSCCWGTPVYGNSNTIAQAFFEAGSFSVVSTFLPISINQGFVLYSRILTNLSNAAQSRIHESWMNFISHNIRTSYIDDLLVPLFDKYSPDILEDEKYIRFRLIWQLRSMNRKTRYSAYNEAKEIIVECIKDEHKAEVECFLKNNEPIPEFMLYTHLGRGDLIKFDSWIQKK
jgi:hypothetical protein